MDKMILESIDALMYDADGEVLDMYESLADDLYGEYEFYEDWGYELDYDSEVW